jgi:7,8-dihydropterin-6-yl-methyl-4-(beta-D-ribofuranosyl)aminobenzene 5'-phosphate synthase
VAPHTVLVTGEVDRSTAFETGFPIHEAYREGAWEADPLILNDQALVVHVAGRGLVILTGCGHSGIVNICRYARRLTGVERIYAVLGGFHLNGAAVRTNHWCDLRRAGGDGAGGDRSQPLHRMEGHPRYSRRFPHSFIQNSVGTTFDLGSAQAA